MTGYSLPVVATRRPLADYNHAAAITPADNTAIGPYRALWIGGAGNLALCMAGDTAVVTLAIPAPMFLEGLNVQGVNATNTTAEHIVGFG